MPGFGVISPVKVTPPFAEDTTTKTVKNLRHDLALNDAASTGGSIWQRSVVDGLGLDDSWSDFYARTVSDSLNLLSVASAVVLRVATASSALALVHINSIAGGRVDGGGGGGSGVTPIDAIFDSTAGKGAVIFVSSNGHVDLAQANAEPQALAIGLAADAVLSGAPGEVITSGPFTNESWNLSPGLVYYLSPSTPGGLTSTFPDALGNRVVIVGAAVTPTQLNIDIHWVGEIGT